jgi:exopolyphosphatase/guanosine-5'-triphosphate,3'-diphosphate pyrophosphatase
MRLGVLDIGSNSAQLQIVEVRPGAPPLPTHAVKSPTHLGEAFAPDGSITEDGVQGVVEAVCRAAEATRKFPRPHARDPSLDRVGPCSWLVSG